VSIETQMINSILRLTGNGPISHELIKKDATMTSESCRKLLDRLQNQGLVNVQKGFVEADGSQRVNLAMEAVRLGADIEDVSSHLQWQEFESIAAVAFERNGYAVLKNLRFSSAGRRWEIDVVGSRRPFVICVDCKHWHHGLRPATLARIAREQTERTSALVNALPVLAGRIKCASWSKAKVVPCILSLLSGAFKFHEGIPIVPVLQLQDFISQLPAHANTLLHYSKTISNLDNWF